MLFVVALPTAISFHFVAIAVIVPLIFILAIVLVLTNEALYQDVMRVVSHVPCCGAYVRRSMSCTATRVCSSAIQRRTSTCR